MEEADEAVATRLAEAVLNHRCEATAARARPREDDRWAASTPIMTEDGSKSWSFRELGAGDGDGL